MMAGNIRRVRMDVANSISIGRHIRVKSTLLRHARGAVIGGIKGAMMLVTSGSIIV